MPHARFAVSMQFKPGDILASWLLLQFRDAKHDESVDMLEGTSILHRGFF